MINNNDETIDQNAFRRRPYHDRGFTLVELIIVIVVLGILSVYVTTRFGVLDTEARKAVLRTLLSSVRNSSTIIHGMTISEHKERIKDATIVLDEQTSVRVSYGYAVAALPDGIVNGLDNLAIAKTGERKEIIAKMNDITVPAAILPSQTVLIDEERQSKLTPGKTIIFSHASARDPTKCCVYYSYDDSADGHLPVIGMILEDCSN